MTIAVLLGSSRKQGNSERLATRLVDGLEADIIYLSDYNIQPIDDYRHAELGAYPADDYRELIDRVLARDTIVFATPIYWYGLSGILKTFIDRWSQSLNENRAEFKARLSGKKAYVIAVGDDEPQLKGLPLIQQFQYIFDYAHFSFEGYVLGKGNKPDSILEDVAALFAVDEFRRKLSAKVELT
ncbi:flavodoxin family protein [Paenibacillus sp. SYP-B3998]|uniref:Flavodoxin family protein n=1 Tax=Paenibacillus sp. SYP-B3998 TaxID=2678564 RepID=A0A6G3ZYP7_9BACL|nr:flavodoxin family protein [Paenibacillus sp. SYP-B3998]NEW06701.1 flavodoxin family protein [Paenibacillus sp. SYP-B3998]